MHRLTVRLALGGSNDHTTTPTTACVGAGGPGIDERDGRDPSRRGPRGGVRFQPAGEIGLTRVLHTRTWEATSGRAGVASAYDEPAAVSAVRAAADLADHVIVTIHRGAERTDCPNADQRHLARLLADAGADVIVGHHPHVLQGVQDLDGTIVAYSMGNFVWYHNSAPSRFTGVLEVELPLLDAPHWQFTPAEIGTDGSPHLAGGALRQAIASRISDRSPGGSVGCSFPAGAS